MVLLHNFLCKSILDSATVLPCKANHSLYRLSYGGIKDERLESSLTSSYVGEYRFSRAVSGEVS